MLLAMTAVSCKLPAADRPPVAADPAIAAQAINALGLDLLARGTAANGNALLSPYSIQSALAMTYAGAAGDTQAEMARVLHFPANEADLHRSFAELRTRLEAMSKASEERAKRAKEWGGPNEPVTLTVANRLFGEQNYEFRAPFLALTKDLYQAPFQPMDFKTAWEAARLQINSWVEEQTRQRIRDLVPVDGLNKNTRLVLVNAVYLKAPWAEVFPQHATKPEPFHVNGGVAVPVPMMARKDDFGYQRGEGFAVVTIPYSGGDLQFVVVVPDAVDGLAAVEGKLTAELLASFAKPNATQVNLHLPKFKLEPPMMRLSEALQSLGMKTAFDKPKDSANFDRMAPRKPDDYLFISDVFHKTFLELDEKGTEAAAATAVVMMRPTSIAPDPPKPVEVNVDRPFLFAIQQRSSGACLFLGRVVDPR